MTYKFFLICYAIGLMSPLGLGPVFILTFNRSAIYGFIRGVLTGIGAALADGLLFMLGLMGFLTYIEKGSNVHIALDLVGGIFLVSAGVYYVKRKIEIESSKIGDQTNPLTLITRVFLITVLNPGTILWFGLLSGQLSDKFGYISNTVVFFGGLMVMLGTLTGLTLVSFGSSRVGSVLTHERLKYVSRVTGGILIGIGMYFLYDFSMGVFNKTYTYFKVNHATNIKAKY